jgi:hypothetical protein
MIVHANTLRPIISPTGNRPGEYQINSIEGYLDLELTIGDFREAYGSDEKFNGYLNYIVWTEIPKNVRKWLSPDWLDLDINEVDRSKNVIRVLVVSCRSFVNFPDPGSGVETDEDAPTS